MSKKNIDNFSLIVILMLVLAIGSVFCHFLTLSIKDNEAIIESCKQQTTSNTKLCKCIDKYNSVNFCVEQYGDY